MNSDDEVIISECFKKTLLWFSKKINSAIKNNNEVFYKDHTSSVIDFFNFLNEVYLDLCYGTVYALLPHDHVAEFIAEDTCKRYPFKTSPEDRRIIRNTMRDMVLTYYEENPTPSENTDIPTVNISISDD